jgi:hypothetical protein
MAQLPPQPQTRRVTRHSCHLNVCRRSQATPVPTALARPTPRGASHNSSPRPCTSQAHSMPVLTVPHAHSCVMQPRPDSWPTTQGNNTAPPRCPHPRARRQNHRTRSHPPRSYRPLPALPTHHQQFAGDVGTQVGHGSLGGEATFTRAAAIAALCPPPP